MQTITEYMYAEKPFIIYVLAIFLHVSFFIIVYDEAIRPIALA